MESQPIHDASGASWRGLGQWAAPPPWPGMRWRLMEPPPCQQEALHRNNQKCYDQMWFSSFKCVCGRDLPQVTLGLLTDLLGGSMECRFTAHGWSRTRFGNGNVWLWACGYSMNLCCDLRQWTRIDNSEYVTICNIVTWSYFCFLFLAVYCNSWLHVFSRTCCRVADCWKRVWLSVCIEVFTFCWTLH